MSGWRWQWLTALLVCTVSCGVTSGTREIEDHPDPLTSGAQDNLFYLTLVEGADFDVASLSVNAGLAGQTATVLHFTHEDANDDGLLNPGERLLAREPDFDLFDVETEGQTVNVALSELRDGIWYQIAHGQWTP
jgi:hypothetical protein